MNSADDGPRIGSVCTGYRGLDMAVEEVFGGRTVWHADIDPGASAILAHHWPDVPNLGDISAVDWDQVEPVDVLTAGFPCQDVSLAGKRAGLTEGTRSGLWHQVARAIQALNPQLVVIENVRGLLSADAHGNVEPCTWCVGDASGEPVLRALGAVLADLAGLGFDAEWQVVRASDVGAAHQRERVFILAWPANAQGSRLEGPHPLRGRPAGDRAAAADADHVGGDRRSTRTGEAGREVPASNTAADTSGVGRGPGEPYVQPGESDAEGRAPTDTEGFRRGEGWPEPAREQGRPGLAGGSGSALADADGSGRWSGTGLVSGQRPAERVQSDSPKDWGNYGPAIARWEHVTGRTAPWAVDARNRLNPVFVEWLMGLEAGHVTDVPGLTRNQQLHALGNGVVPQQAAAAIRLLAARAGIPAPTRQAA